VHLEWFGDSLWPRLAKYSSLVPLGAHVLDWDFEYRQFYGHFSKINDAFRAYYPGKTEYTLDYEYKKDRNLVLVVKQVREIPPDSADEPQTMFLVNEPTDLVVAQAEYGDVFANHRLKSQLRLESPSMWLVNSNLVNGLYSTGAFEYLQDGARQTLSGEVASWPGAAHSPDGSLQSWVTGPATNNRAWRLRTDVRTNTLPREPLVVFPSDFRRELEVIYAHPVPTITWEGEVTVTNETVLLESRRELTPGSILVERSFGTPAKGIETSYYWPEPPRGAVAGYTAPLVKFVETRIAGLTSSPVVLTNYFSQTYRPGHHNFTEFFILEPGLEPGLPEATHAELRANNVQLIYWQVGFEDSARILGLDGKFRPF
jgi:hypothetical protein